MAKVSFWKILGLIGVLSEEVSTALGDDGKISVGELLHIGKAVIEKLDFPMDEESAKKIEVVLSILDEDIHFIEDGRITISELIVLAETVCSKFGVVLDKEGFDI